MTRLGWCLWDGRPDAYHHRCPGVTASGLRCDCPAHEWDDQGEEEDDA